MAVKVDPPKQTNEFDMRSFLRAQAERELADLRASKPQPQPTEMQNQLTNLTEPSVNQNSSGSPLEGGFRVTQNFGNYNPQLYAGKTQGSKHLGLDLATPEGTVVKSPFAGIVKTGQDKDFGKFVEIRTQDGRIMRFSHLKSIDDLAMRLGAAGREIQAGQSLGFTGSTGNSTGPHLDIMYQLGGQWVDPRQYEPLQRAIR